MSGIPAWHPWGLFFKRVFPLKAVSASAPQGGHGEWWCSSESLTVVLKSNTWKLQAEDWDKLIAQNLFSSEYIMEHHAVRCKTHFSVPAVWVLSPYGCTDIVALPWFHPGHMVTWEGVSYVCYRGIEYSWVAPGEVSNLTGSVTQSWLENVRLVSQKECLFCPDVGSTGASVCWYLQSCWICYVNTIIWCFFLKNVVYFKNIFYRNLIQQQICLKDFRNHR